MKYTSRITQMTILPVGEPLFSDRATVVSIVDKAAGEYIQVKQQADTTSETDQTIAFDPDEWEEVTDVVNQMFGEIRRYKEETQ
jgi:hypothetical protein